MSATFLANHGSTVLELQQKHNWKNPSMVLEYIANTNRHQENMASKIQGIPQTEVRNASAPIDTLPSTSVSNLPSSSATNKSSEIEPPANRVKSANDEKNVVLPLVGSESSDGAPMYKFENHGCTINIYHK